jgi:type II secretory pathway predicted ATPase ExeA
MNYLEFYNLKEEPFSNAPTSKFYFDSEPHSFAISKLMYAVDTMKGLAVLVGDIGTGKTTLARRMLDSLPEENYEAALLVIIHSSITASWLLKRIALQIGVNDPSEDKIQLLTQLYRRLVDIHESGRRSVVLIDEAQMLCSKEIMEEFRGLLNLEVAERKLLTFIFFGLPEIENNLKLDMPLYQRIALKCRLGTLNEKTTYSYIHHRLRLAGCNSTPFDEGALRMIHRYSKGIPRLINTFCDNALLEGYIRRVKIVNGEIVESVATDLGVHESIPSESANYRQYENISKEDEA